MLTLTLLHDAINTLRDTAAREHQAREHQETLLLDAGSICDWVETCDGEYIQPPMDGWPDYAIHGHAERRAECARLAMALHDVVRGCRTDDDLINNVVDQAADSDLRALVEGPF